MPYIGMDKRTAIDRAVGELDLLMEDEGELNYAITRLVDMWAAFPERTYQSLNAVIGVLECVKLELYRRVVAPYEDEKKEANGDVYNAG